MYLMTGMGAFTLLLKRNILFTAASEFKKTKGSTPDFGKAESSKCCTELPCLFNCKWWGGSLHFVLYKNENPIVGIHVHRFK